jgi:hypothetical protein
VTAAFHVQDRRVFTHRTVPARLPRYYDKLALLATEFVDPNTGYRY